MKKIVFLLLVALLCVGLLAACSNEEEEHIHAYGEWVVITEATCTEDGLRERSCSCGEKEQEAIPAGHSFVENVCVGCGLKASEGLKFKLNKDWSSYSVSGIGTCTDTDVVIPNVYEGLYVTSIGYGAFYYCTDLTSVTIPDSVTSIGDYALAYCTSMESITIPDSVTSIGDYAFEYCTSMESITIPNGVISVGDFAFWACNSPTSIFISNSVTSIGLCAFSIGYGLTSIVVAEGNPVYHSKDNCLIETTSKTLIAGCKNSVIPTDGSVTSIGDGAFSGCTSLTSITIPDSVTSIGEASFIWCFNLTSITIPDSVNHIGSQAFEDTAYYGDDSNWVNGVLYIGNHLIEAKTSISGSYAIREGTKCIAEDAFRNCDSLTHITIPDSVSSIGCSAFARCSNMTRISVSESNQNFITVDGVLYSKDMTRILWVSNTVTEFCIPRTVTDISGAFYGNSQLTTVTFEDECQLTSISEYSFYDCTGLTSITIPDSVTFIGSDAFSRCKNLASVAFEDPNGWYILEVSDAVIDVTDASAAARYLRSTYCDYYWYRIE